MHSRLSERPSGILEFMGASTMVGLTRGRKGGRGISRKRREGGREEEGRLIGRKRREEGGRGREVER